VQQVELVALDPSLYGSLPHADLPQLTSAHHPMLAARKLGDLPVPIASRHFAFYANGNCRLVSHAVKDEAARRTCGARFVPTPSLRAHKRPQPAVAASGFDPFK
jgi:hypothetical protein